MTENEAIAVRFIENIKNHAMVTLDHITKEESNVSPLVYKGREEKADTILAMVEELKQYRTIGTLKKCRAAVVKKLDLSPIGAKIGRCTACLKRQLIDQTNTHCPKCGQKLKWEDEE